MHTIDELKSLVFGRSRGTDIKITPCHYDGDHGAQIHSLARDKAATKYPPDEDEITVAQRGARLSELLEFNGNADSVADALIQYARSRVERTGRGAVEEAWLICGQSCALAKQSQNNRLHRRTGGPLFRLLANFFPRPRNFDVPPDMPQGVQ